MNKTVEVWCCGISADHELGETNVEVYPSKEDVLKHCQCSTIDPDRCSPRKLTVTFDTGWNSAEVGVDPRIGIVSAILYRHGILDNTEVIAKRILEEVK